jgi:hypothetical protein
MQMDRILNHAQADRARELVQKYVRREPNAVTLIDELLSLCFKLKRFCSRR